MIAVIIEPALLAVPPIAESEDEIEAIIERVMLWSRYVLDGGIVCVSQMSDTTDVLATSGCWPSTGNVSALLELYNLKHVYTPSEVSRLVNTILERAVTARDAFGFEVTSCKPSLPTPIEYQSDDLRNAGDRARSTILSAPRHSFLAPHVKPTGPRISFEAVIESCASEKDASPYQSFPLTIAGDIHLAETPQCLGLALKATELWDTARSTADIHFAISKRAIELGPSLGLSVEIESVPQFAVGSDFLTSLVRTQCGPHSRFGHAVLEHAARIVLGQPKNDLDVFATGPRSVSSDQRLRSEDGARAYRNHVTKGAEALRLIVWQHPSGIYEFANVGSHNDLTLCEGDMSLLVRWSWRNQ